MIHFDARRFSCSIFLAFCALAFLQNGCCHYRPDSNELAVVPLANQNIVALEAEDIVRMALRAGFTDEEILTVGTDLRNQMAASGGAQVVEGKLVRAMFACNPPYIHASSLMRGTFIYDLRTHRIK